MKLHSGIRIDQISPKGGPGLIFVLIVLALLLVGLPETRPFLIFSVAAGILIAGLLRLLQKH